VLVGLVEVGFVGSLEVGGFGVLDGCVLPGWPMQVLVE